jgi:c-di-GMP-binding flagellar brake protein YcgR
MPFDFKKLKTGSLVEISIDSSQNKRIKLKTIVENILDDKRLILFAPVFKGVNYPLRIHQSFDLIMVYKQEHLDQYDIFSCQCEIVERMQTDNISTIGILRTGEFKQIQRRDYFRLPLIKTMEFTYENRVYQVLSKDLSGNGLKGYTDLKLPIDSECILNLDTEDGKLSINFKVIECSPDPEHVNRYELRASFIRVKNTQRSALLKYIFTKQSEVIRKQIDFNNSPSILNTNQHYGDYFQVTSKEKVARLGTVGLWAITSIEIAFLISAFKSIDMGLNEFFKEFQPSFRPERLKISTTTAALSLILSFVVAYFNESFNKRTKKNIRLHLLCISALAICSLIIGILYGS